MNAQLLTCLAAKSRMLADEVIRLSFPPLSKENAKDCGAARRVSREVPIMVARVLGVECVESCGSGILRSHKLD